MNEITEYEVSGIENIARGVVFRGGKVLLCAPKNGGYTYLPGGHIEFGETAAEALEREMREETGLEVEVGKFLGVVESRFEQRGRLHCEISLVYAMTLKDDAAEVNSREDWIEFLWCDTGELGNMNMLPREMRELVK